MEGKGRGVKRRKRKNRERKGGEKGRSKWGEWSEEEAASSGESRACLSMSLSLARLVAPCPGPAAAFLFNLLHYLHKS